jgi:hypothetical protein
MTAKSDDGGGRLVARDCFRANQRAGLTQTGQAPVANAANVLSMLPHMFPSVHVGRASGAADHNWPKAIIATNSHALGEQRRPRKEGRVSAQVAGETLQGGERCQRCGFGAQHARAKLA